MSGRKVGVAILAGRPPLKGEVGDPASIRFCEEVGLDYVSCSPFRVPIARLAAAGGGEGVVRALYLE